MNVMNIFSMYSCIALENVDYYYYFFKYILFIEFSIYIFKQYSPPHNHGLKKKRKKVR